MENSLFLKGMLYLTLIPTLLIIFSILALSLSLLDIMTIVVIISYSLAIYSIILLHKNTYTDPEVLDMVVIPNAPKEIEDLLKRTTRGTYKLINVSLIAILGVKKSLCQSDLVKYLKKLGIDLSAPAITPYISDLENAGIFSSKKGAYRIEYSLTKRGEWCYKAVRTCFPKRFFFLIIRHYLRFRKLPEFPDSNEI